jgi:hypothetical protein
VHAGGCACDGGEKRNVLIVSVWLDLGASNPQAPIAAARNAAGPVLMEAYRAMVRANGRRVAAVRGAELVAILGVDPETLSEDELRSVYMASLGAAAHGSVQARAEALGITTTEYFLAGGAAGVHGLSAREIRARAHDVRRRAATAGGAELVAILGVDPETLSEDEIRSVYMASIGQGGTTGRTTQVPAPIGERERKRYKEREKERVRERERVRSIL